MPRSKPVSGRCRPARAAPGRPVSGPVSALVVLLGQTGFLSHGTGSMTMTGSTRWPHARITRLPPSGLGVARTPTWTPSVRWSAESAPVRGRAAGRDPPPPSSISRARTISDRRPGPVSPALALLRSLSCVSAGGVRPPGCRRASLWDGLCSDGRKPRLRCSWRSLVTQARPRNCAPGARVADEHGRDG